jgi:hypothetical protein
MNRTQSQTQTTFGIGKTLHFSYLTSLMKSDNSLFQQQVSNRGITDVAVYRLYSMKRIAIISKLPVSERNG